MKRGALVIFLLVILLAIAPLVTPRVNAAQTMPEHLLSRWDFGNETSGLSSLYCQTDFFSGQYWIYDGEVGHNYGSQYKTATYANVTRIIADCDALGTGATFVLKYTIAGNSTVKTYTKATAGTIDIGFNTPTTLSRFDVGWTGSDAEQDQVRMDYVFIYHSSPNYQNVETWTIDLLTKNFTWNNVETWTIDLYTRLRQWLNVETWLFNIFPRNWIPSPMQDPEFFVFILAALGSVFSCSFLLSRMGEHDVEGSFGWLIWLFVCIAFMLGVILI